MQSIFLDQLLDKWEAEFKAFPHEKHEMLEEIGKELLKLVRKNIRATRMNHNGGKLQNWQQSYVGSRNGYAAVRARPSGDDDHKDKRHGPGAITNYTENGHRIRPPNRSATRSSRYSPRIKVTSVSGYHYYYKSTLSAEALAERIAQKYLNKLAQKLDGAA